MIYLHTKFGMLWMNSQKKFSDKRLLISKQECSKKSKCFALILLTKFLIQTQKSKIHFTIDKTVLYFTVKTVLFITKV